MRTLSANSPRSPRPLESQFSTCPPRTPLARVIVAHVVGTIPLPAEEWSQAITRVGSATGPIAWSWAAVRGQGNLQLFLLAITSARSADYVLLDYGDILIGREQLTPVAAAQRLRRGIAAQTPALEFTPPTSTIYPMWVTAEVEFRYALALPEWPHYYGNWSLPQVSGANPSGAQSLIKAGQPFYATLSAALGDILYGSPPNEVQPNLSPGILIRLPDLRGHFGRPRVNEGVVELPVIGGRRRLRKALVEVTWRDTPIDSTWKRQAVAVPRSGLLELDTGGVPSELWALLWCDQEVVDRTGWSEATSAEVEIAGSPELRAERWIAEGESVQIEYKQELKDDSAKESFAGTVAAFANAAGGVILVGVADNSEVIGWDPPKAADLISNIVHGRLSAPVDISLQRVVVRGKPIWEVIVPTGDRQEQPYRCSGRVFVRALGTTRQATTAELRRLAAPTTSATLSYRRRRFR